MASFATTTDMAERSQGAITVTTHPFLQKELNAATRAIQNECGWHIAPTQTVTRRIRSGGWRPIWIPAMQIASVKITPFDGTLTDLAEDAFDPDTGWTSWSGDRYTLEYTAGYSPVPEDLVALTLEIAAGALGVSLGLTREQAGGVSVSYARTGGGLTAADKARLAAYRIGRLP